MDEKILELTYQLKTALDNDSRIALLNKLEEQMNNNEEVMGLSYRKDVALDKYNEMCKYFKDDSEEVINARKELATAKKELESHPLVREYLAAYQQVRILFEHINETLFSYLNKNMCPSEVK